MRFADDIFLSTLQELQTMLLELSEQNQAKSLIYIIEKESHDGTRQTLCQQTQVQYWQLCTSRAELIYFIFTKTRPRKANEVNHTLLAYAKSHYANSDHANGRKSIEHRRGANAHMDISLAEDNVTARLQSLSRWFSFLSHW